jgi:hypothetical protein
LPIHKTLTLSAPTIINLVDDEHEAPKEVFPKSTVAAVSGGKRDAQENGSGESNSKKQKLISTDPDELVNIIKQTIKTPQTTQSTVVSSASESDG